METEKLDRATPSSAPRPPSSTSSPSHDFSFTISLHPPTFADDIFFHGHLLPLHFLSHRPSNSSIETHQNLTQTTDHHPPTDSQFEQRPKTKPFSSFFPLRNWLRGSGDRAAAEKQRNKNNKKRASGGLWKKYASFMEPPLLFFFKGMKERRELRRRSSHSFSGDRNPRERGWRRRWRGEFSAPASMRTSPANSGLLVAPSAAAFSSSDESTMEDLQNAIQAAIAHCKNSVAVKDDRCGC